MKPLLFPRTNEHKLHIRFVSWMHELAGFHKKIICFTFLDNAFDFYLCNHFIFEKHQARLLVLVNIWWFSIFTRGVSQSSVVSVTRVWTVANLKDFSPTVWTSQLVDFLSLFSLNKEKTHQQLGTDCWVLKVGNSSCSNFYVAGNNSWSKAKNKATTVQTFEGTSTITKTMKRRKTLVHQTDYFPAKHLNVSVCVYSKWRFWLERYNILIQGF